MNECLWEPDRHMIKAILAVDEKGGIGKDNTLPWPKNTEDMQWFVKNTKGQTVVMGSGTWNSIGMPKPLPNRINVVVTSDRDSNPGANHYISEDLIQGIKNMDILYGEDVYIIGGANLIEQCLDVIDEFLITRISGDYNCDTKLPLELITDNFNLAETIQGETVRFEIWQKK